MRCRSLDLAERLRGGLLNLCVSEILHSAFILLLFPSAPIRGSLAQFLYINWRPADREQEYAKLHEAVPRARQKHPRQAETAHCRRARAPLPHGVWPQRLNAPVRRWSIDHAADLSTKQTQHQD